VQIGVTFIVPPPAGSAFYYTAVHELGWALASSVVATWRWSPTAARAYATDGVHVVRAGGATLYEALVKAADLGVQGFAANDLIAFSLMVNDDDDGCRKGWLAWTAGIGRGKDASSFGTLLLLP
jgi:hypothetical protein